MLRARNEEKTFMAKLSKDIVIVGAKRTAFGTMNGALKGISANDLAVHAAKAALAQAGVAPADVEHVIVGNVMQTSADAIYCARHVGLKAGVPIEVPAVTVNRLCGSGLEAVCDAVRRIATGDAECVVAGGVESMTRAPFVFAKADEPFPRLPPRVFDTSLGWRFENPRMAERFPLHSMGETAENVAEKWKIGREEQDAFALASHERATAAQKAGAFADEIAPVSIPQKKGEPLVVAVDESPRPDASLAALAKLAPVFRKGGTVTAGNSSPLNDGASAVLVVSEEVLRAENLEPLARVVASATAGVEPGFMGEGPIPAGKKALARASWTVNDLELVELNEAFAAQSIACIRGLELDPSRVNVGGGAIALGHPIGSSGCRVLVTLVHAMRRRRVRRGMAALCIGVGQGIAMCVER
jgi:acetyl-CoA acetyltransferase family protein